jgi:hypothetical protein
VRQVSEGYKHTGVGVYRFRLDRRRDINLMNIEMLTWYFRLGDVDLLGAFHSPSLSNR